MIIVGRCMIAALCNKLQAQTSCNQLNILSGHANPSYKCRPSLLLNYQSQQNRSYLAPIAKAEMAQVSILKKASILAVVAVALSAAFTVSAQGPAPSPDAGAAFSLPTSGVLVGTSLLFSFIALFRN
ncbi:hypothetical protein L2E82_00940 [Cichorium intybus]|uniref:Uncharacterized protein n=1 Tax=Cichorium intybus TaxID=13427 RepID=A0ACB9GYD4_CICIN|nr:hypothetical protein L2E82_00940 [Cichorium intybus]